MRPLAPLLLTLLTGCSTMVAEMGTDVGKITTAADAQRQFGASAARGSTADPAFARYSNGRKGDEPRVFENFYTRRKIANPGASYSHISDPTYGLSEFVTLPPLLWNAGKSFVLGNNVCFTYDQQGHVNEVFVNGKLEHSHGPSSAPRVAME